MLESVSPEQRMEIALRLIRDVEWKVLSPRTIQERVIQMDAHKLGRRFTAFLQYDCQPLERPSEIVVDRAKPFRAAMLATNAHTVQEDRRAVLMEKISFDRLRLETGMLSPSDRLSGEELIMRMEHHNPFFVPADANVAEALLNEPGKRTLQWIYTELGHGALLFPGTIIKMSRDQRSARYVYRNHHTGEWTGGTRWLSHTHGDNMVGVFIDTDPLLDS